MSYGEMVHTWMNIKTLFGVMRRKMYIYQIVAADLKVEDWPVSVQKLGKDIIQSNQVILE